MAVQTIKATIQMRYGNEADLKPDQLVAGEWAVANDTKKVWMCFRPGLVLRMATYESFEQDMKEIQLIFATCQDIQVAVEKFLKLAEQHASTAEEWSVASKSWAVGGTGTRTGEDTDNSKYYSEQSKAEADRAKSEADRAAAIVGIDVDSELSETSANPVQNKVITAEIEKKVNKEEGKGLFSGNYNDLEDKPEIPSGTNNLLATIPGTWLDAVQGKELKDGMDAISSNLNVLKNFNCTRIIKKDNPDTLQTINIEEQTVMVRAHFWYSGTSDPQYGYLNFYKNFPGRNVQILHFYDSKYEAFATVDVSWIDKQVSVTKLSLPNQYWKLAIEQWV